MFIDNFQCSESYIKPLRDVTFYRDNGTTETLFNGQAVILKTLSAPIGTSNYVPDIVKQILNTPTLNRHVNIDAVFFSKVILYIVTIMY